MGHDEDAFESITVISDVPSTLGRRLRIRGRRGQILGATVGGLKQLLGKELHVPAEQLLLRLAAAGPRAVARELCSDTALLQECGVTRRSMLRVGLRVGAPHLVDVIVKDSYGLRELHLGAIDAGRCSVGELKGMVAQAAGVPATAIDLGAAHEPRRILDDGASLARIARAASPAPSRHVAGRVVFHLVRTPLKAAADDRGARRLGADRPRLASPATPPPPRGGRRRVNVSILSPLPDDDDRVPPPPSSLLLRPFACSPEIESVVVMEEGDPSPAPRSTEGSGGDACSAATMLAPDADVVDELPRPRPVLCGPPATVHRAASSSSSTGTPLPSTESLRRRLTEIEAQLRLERHTPLLF